MLRMNEAVEIPSDVLVRVVNGESVILNVTSEFYFGLDDVSTEFWQAIEKADTLQDAMDELTTVFDVDQTRLQTDYETFVSELLAAGLLVYRTPAA